MIKKVFVSLCMGCALFGLVASTPSATAEVLVSQPQTVRGAELYAFGQKFSSSLLQGPFSLIRTEEVDDDSFIFWSFPGYEGLSAHFEYFPTDHVVFTEIYNTMVPPIVHDRTLGTDAQNRYQSFLSELQKVLATKDGEKISIENDSPLLTYELSATYTDVLYPTVTHKGNIDILQFYVRIFSRQDFSRGDIAHIIMAFNKDTKLLLLTHTILATGDISTGPAEGYAEFLNKKGYTVNWQAPNGEEFKKFIPPVSLVKEYIDTMLITDRDITSLLDELNKFVSTSTVAKAFTDVSYANEYYHAMQYMNGTGIMTGYADGSFGAGKQINRAEFVKTLFSGTTISSDGCYTQKQQKGWTYMYFKDVPMDAWYAPYVCVAKEKGIISGYGDGLFHPEQNITKAEAMKIVVEHYYRGVRTYMPTENAWYEKYYSMAEEIGVFDRNFYPDPQIMEQKLLRSEMAGVLSRVLLVN